MTDRNWIAYIADADHRIITDPEAIASLLTHESGTISIRRGSALPNNNGQLPGLDEHDRLDVFGELDLDDVHPDDAAEIWKLTQAAATGMNAGTDWRDYTLEPTDDGGVAALCRSDENCMDARLNDEGRHLTLGEAADWAQEHVRWHAEHSATEVKQP